MKYSIWARYSFAPRATLIEEAKLRVLVATNRDVMIRTVCVLAVGQVFIHLAPRKAMPCSAPMRFWRAY